jgi:hypothetical protein
MGSGILVLTNLLDLMLGLTLYYFSFRMYRDAIKEEVPPDEIRTRPMGIWSGP